MIDTHDIITALEFEIRDTPKYIELTVEDRKRIGDYWELRVKTANSGYLRSGTLDESLEGASAWWKNDDRRAATADVLSVVPEESAINLRYCSESPPDSGNIRLYLPLYLESLLELWSKEIWAEKCARWLDEAERENTFDRARTVDSAKYLNFLRQNQLEAFNLPGWKTSFLHGPPGTGKTTTLGCVLAEYLIRFPKRRILLLSTTNLAVDQALVAVDKALEKDLDKSSADARKKCRRIGNHFNAAYYADRRHLLPVQDEKLVSELAGLQASRPDSGDVQNFGAWKRKLEIVKTKIKALSSAVIENSSLAAMTTTRAVFTFSEVAKFAPFDLIVFDESSQVGQAHALALAPLGRNCLFAGDPQQLAPIFRSKHESVETWLGRSMFDRRHKFDREANVFLDEQSRMVEAICKIVSSTFYNGKLKVAEKELNDQNWIRERKLDHIPEIGANSVSAIKIDAAHTWSARYGGNIRHDSAQKIRDLVIELSLRTDQSDILVLTPFRAQRSLIKAFLKNAGCTKVKVSTVHRAQGGECRTVIFDPVAGNSDFLKTDDAVRLINVALSRAQARLIILLSPADLENEVLRRIYYLATAANTISKSDASKLNSESLKLILSSDFPHCAVDKDIQINKISGRVTRILEEGRKFRLRDHRTGEGKTFITAFIKQTAEKFAAEKELSGEKEKLDTNLSVKTHIAPEKETGESGSPKKPAEIKNRPLVKEKIKFSRIILDNDFPHCALTKNIEFKKVKGTVISVSDGGKKFCVLDPSSGQTRVFSTEAVKQMCGR